MAESNGVVAEEGDAKSVEIESTVTGEPRSVEAEEDTLWGLLHRFAAGIFSVDGHPPPPLLRRIWSSLAESAPRLRVAGRNTGRELLIWARRGSPLRPLLLISVGTITLLALTGLLVFMLFFLAATFNAIVISFLVSLATAGGFLALFFACLTAIYIGALSAAVFVISVVTISTVIAVVVATGWIGFLLTIWLVAKKSVGLAKHSLSMTGSAISAYSATHRVWHQPKKDQ